MAAIMASAGSDIGTSKLLIAKAIATTNGLIYVKADGFRRMSSRTNLNGIHCWRSDRGLVASPDRFRLIGGFLAAIVSAVIGAVVLLLVIGLFTPLKRRSK
jgi:hypothetical protein